jgi:hypothetical protein
MAPSSGIIFPASMADYLDNLVDICFSSMPTVSVSPAAWLIIKNTAVTSAHLTHDKLVIVASMIPKAAAVSHGYNTLVVSGAVLVFWVARESPTTVDP